MRKFSNKLADQQSGFTLIELVIVIVIIGILAAVAIPNLGSTADEATRAKNNATLGALKSAYSIVYAQTRVAPTCAATATALIDPGCTAAGTVITCTGITKPGATTAATFTCASATLASSAGLTCTATSDCS